VCETCEGSVLQLCGGRVVDDGVDAGWQSGGLLAAVGSRGAEGSQRDFVRAFRSKSERAAGGVWGNAGAVLAVCEWMFGSCRPRSMQKLQADT